MMFRDVMCVLARHISAELNRWNDFELIMLGVALIGIGVTLLILFGG